MGATYGHGGHLDLWTMSICTYFQSPFNTRLHVKFEEIWLRGFRGEVIQMCGWTDRQGVITIAHPDPFLKILVRTLMYLVHFLTLQFKYILINYLCLDICTPGTKQTEPTSHPFSRHIKNHVTKLFLLLCVTNIL